MARIPVNNLVGKKVIKNNDYKKLSEAGLSERDIRNMRANLIDMSITLAWVAMLLFTKAMLWDDDDEQDSARRKAHNLLANRFMQMSSQATMYLDPVETWDNTMGNLPTIRFFTDVQKTATEAQEFLEGKDTIPTGPNAGESALYNQMEKTFFPGILKGNFGFEVHQQRQFQKSPFDSWFHGDEKKAKTKIQSIKAKTKKRYLVDGLDAEKEKELNKQITKFYKKGKDETYSDVLKRIEEQQFTPE
jgi:flavodoxin